MNFKLPLGLTAKRSRSSQENKEEENDAKRVKIQNEGQELVVNCDIGRPRCLLCRLQSFHLKDLCTGENLLQPRQGYLTNLSETNIKYLMTETSTLNSYLTQYCCFRLNMVSPDALRYHNLMRHPDLTPNHTLVVSPSKATASAPTSPIKKITSLAHHKRLSLPDLPLKWTRVKVMREVEVVKDVGRAALDERLTESPKKEKEPPRKSSLDGVRSDDSGMLTEEGFLEDLLDGVGDIDIKQEDLSLPELLKRILDHLAVLDKGNMFKEPVDLEEAPDYLACIPKPMDFSTMQNKVELEEYSSLESFEEDFLLVVSNCLTYNEEDTKFWRAGRRIKTTGLAVIEDARLGRLGKEPSERKPSSRISKEFKKRKSKDGGGKTGGKSAPCQQKRTKAEPKTERKKSESPSDSGVSSTNSTTAHDSDNSITSSEFAVPAAPRYTIRNFPSIGF